jgi:hypothetical protein
MEVLLGKLRAENIFPLILLVCWETFLLKMNLFINIKFCFWALMALDWNLNPIKYTIFELGIKFYIKSSPKH